MDRSTTVSVEIVEFRAELAPAFETLNRAWIEQDFRIEPADEAVFQDPAGHIIRPGGQILFAVVAHEIVGTCALIPHEVGTYELAKMAVAEKVRGRGVGDRLMTAAIEWARATGAQCLLLVTNSRLTPALRLYQKHGFMQVQLEPGGDYARADVKMVLTLENHEPTAD